MGLDFGLARLVTDIRYSPRTDNNTIAAGNGLDLEEFPQIKEFYEKSIKLKKSSDCSCGKVCKGDGNGKF